MTSSEGVGKQVGPAGELSKVCLPAREAGQPSTWTLAFPHSSLSFPPFLAFFM